MYYILYVYTDMYIIINMIVMIPGPFNTKVLFNSLILMFHTDGSFSTRCRTV